jgi:hypothetical protein
VSPAAGSDGPVLPSLVGKVLTEAKEKARDAGFTVVTSHDAVGTRSQIVDSNWQVCVQSPGQGLSPRARPSTSESFAPRGSAKSSGDADGGEWPLPA